MALLRLTDCLKYGLQTAFSEIERLHHEVVSGGNPIGMDLKTRYVTKGVSKEQIISSRINIFYDKDTNKITKVQDKWGGELPDSSFKNVSIEQLLDPWWWVHYAEGWAWWLWSFTWDTWWWQVCGSHLSHSMVSLLRTSLPVETLSADRSCCRLYGTSTLSLYRRWSVSPRTMKRTRSEGTSNEEFGMIQYLDD